MVEWGWIADGVLYVMIMLVFALVIDWGGNNHWHDVLKKITFVLVWPVGLFIMMVGLIFEDNE